VGGASRWTDGNLLRQSMEAGGFKGKYTMRKAKSINDVDDLKAWIYSMWSLLGRMEHGWIPSDEENWDRAIQIFGNTLIAQKDVEVLRNGKARMTSWCWVAVGYK
jgi:hypothetical protein